MRLSREVPEVVIELHEVCAGLYTPTVYTTFRNRTAESKYGRNLDSDELDFKTIDACADFLCSRGCNEAAELLEKHMKD